MSPAALSPGEGPRELEETPGGGRPRPTVSELAATRDRERAMRSNVPPIEPRPVWAILPAAARSRAGRLLSGSGSRARAGGTDPTEPGGETTLVEAIAAGIAHEVRNR
jgi:hypothetical protein